MKPHKLIHVFYSLVIILSIVVVLPLILDLFDLSTKILVLSTVGNYLIIIIIGVTIVDLFFLVVDKKNQIVLAFISMSLMISLFLLMEYCFLNDYFSFIYVFENSKTTLPIIYKLAAIWASEEGSIITWMVFNSIIIAFYRIKSGKEEDIVFIRSVIITLLISTTFYIILYFLVPFGIQPGMPGEGLWNAPLLESPYMIIHPPFVFLGYAIFLVPFAIALSELITPNSKLELPYQRSYLSFTIKFGWLVISLGIGIGAYWASITSGWGGYWAWDPVETVSLIPWILCTAYFHSMSLKSKKPNIVRYTIMLVFLTSIFATLLTRAGSISPLHSFAGGGDLFLWATIIGLLTLVLMVYIIYDILNLILEGDQNAKSLINYLSYLFLLLMAFIFNFALVISPLTLLLSSFLSVEVIYISPFYYSVGGLVCATGLAISLIFCSLYDFFDLKQITLFIVVSFFGGLSVVLFLFFTTSIWINPVISFYVIAFFVAVYHLARNLNMKHGIKLFFRKNSKIIIHAGISLLLVGTVTGIWPLVQSIFYIIGFSILVFGIIPSILVIFLIKTQTQKYREEKTQDQLQRRRIE